MTCLVRCWTASSGLCRCLHRSHWYGLPCHPGPKETP